MVSPENGITWPEIHGALQYRAFAMSKGQQLPVAEAPQDMGFLRQGLLYLCWQDEQMNRQILLLHRPGELLQPAALPGELRSGADYLAREGCQLVWFTPQAFLSLTALSGERVTASLLGQSCALLRSQALLHRRTLRSRLLAYFHREAQRQGSPRITLPMPLSDLADYLGADRSAMMKELRRMKEDGLITGRGRALEITDAA